MEYPINERVRQLMKALGYTGAKQDAHDFGLKLLGKGERTEKVKNFYNDVNAISAELLVLVTTKIVNDKGQKPNGHWLLTGEGEMFLEEKHTAATNSDEAAIIKEALQELREQLAFLRIQNSDLTKALLKGKVIEQSQ